MSSRAPARLAGLPMRFFAHQTLAHQTLQLIPHRVLPRETRRSPAGSRPRLSPLSTCAIKNFRPISYQTPVPSRIRALPNPAHPCPSFHLDLYIPVGRVARVRRHLVISVLLTPDKIECVHEQ